MWKAQTRNGSAQNSRNHESLARTSLTRDRRARTWRAGLRRAGASREIFCGEFAGCGVRWRGDSGPVAGDLT